MKILSLKMEGFKPFAESKEFNFDPTHTVISGDNYTGKTTIIEAIVWGLLGVNLQGSDRVDTLLNTGSKRMMIDMVMEHDGQTHQLRRYKAKGSPVLEIDGKKATQVQLEGMIGSKDVMLATILPGYFAGLDAKKGRELLVSLMTRIPKEEVMEALDPATREALTYLDLIDTNDTLKSLRADLKAAKENNIHISGQLEEIQSTMKQEIPEEQAFDDVELQGLINQKAAMENSQPELIDTAELEREITELRFGYERKRNEIKVLPVMPSDTCEGCGQQIPDHMRQAVIERFNTAMQSAQAMNEATKAEMARIIEEGKQKSAKLGALKLENENRLAGYSKPDTTSIQARISELSKQQGDTIFHNAKRNHILASVAHAKVREGEYRKNIEVNNMAIDVLTGEIAAVVSYAAKYAELQINQLSQHLTRTSIKLLDVVKTTGELKPVFKVLYDGKEQNVLSNSERIRCGLEMANLICKLAGLDVPVFVDNAESITHFDVPERQLFTATVVRGSELEVKF